MGRVVVAVYFRFRVDVPFFADFFTGFLLPKNA
jgi:hypothetical protein